MCVGYFVPAHITSKHIHSCVVCVFVCVRACFVSVPASKVVLLILRGIAHLTPPSEEELENRGEY